MECSPDTGRCYVPGVCGNGELEPGEECDDGNTASGDGCRGDCQSLERCGNGQLDLGEQCDCGDSRGNVRDPGCQGQANSSLEGVCRTDCRLHCGDGELHGDELCDGELLGTSCVGLGFDRGQISCNESCIPETEACDLIGWRRETIGIENIYALWGTAADNIYAVGEETPEDPYFIHHYDGSQWRNIEARFGNDCAPPVWDCVALYGVWGLGPDSIYALGDKGLVLHRSPAGVWNQLDIGVRATLRAIWGTAEDNIYLVGHAGDDGPTLLHYDGARWRSLAAELPALPAPVHLDGIAGHGADDIYAVGVVGSSDEGVVLHYDGSAWRTVAAADASYLAHVHAAADGHTLAVGLHGYIAERQPDGSFREVSERLSDGLIGAWSSDARQAFAVGRSGDILFSDGTAWEPVHSGVSVRLETVWGIAREVLVAAGWNGTLLHYRHQSWLPTPRPSDTDLRDLWASDLHIVYAVGNDVFRYRDGAWTAMGADLGVKLHSILGRSSGELMVGGRDGVIGYYRDGTWTTVAGGTGAGGRIHALWESASGHVFAVGFPQDSSLGYVMQCQGNACAAAAGWKGRVLTDASALYDVWGSSERDVYAVGENGTVLHYDGDGWTRIETGTEEHLFGVWGADDGTLYAVGDRATILRREGGQWTEMALPYAAARFSWMPEVQLRSVWGSGPEDVYVAGNRDGLLLHYDGAGWAPVRTDTDQPLLRLWGRSQSRAGEHDVDVFIAGESGTVLRLIKRL
ncbi:hypothetical protein [Haliangium ochraceum]|uniref:Cysteine-rich repeat protein n=1 Tax=Haliangium ochraceum (strain DSM 14365 / JCM 11303 / SMP-2) TaxID=502025 RepID=D0LIY2_HALO1|nr:hypothetical protein [Haliangium ochraceum]ACY13011.1 cysteine-rich repeat protein [Haliangium ochraceum DSM 14365]